MRRRVAAWFTTRVRMTMTTAGFYVYDTTSGAGAEGGGSEAGRSRGRGRQD